MNPASRATATAVVLATAGALLNAAAPAASAATTCTAPTYKRTFYANTTFSGTPKKTDCDSVIDQNWTGAPASGLPKDNFAVRWSVTRDFGSGGPFAFAASGTDGIRVYLDGVRKTDLWSNTSGTRAKTVNVTVPKGRHTLRVDYANFTGAASVKFAYTPRTSAAVDTVRPLAPTGVSWDQYTGQPPGIDAVLAWTANKEMDLAGYRVYRRVAGTSAFTRVGATTVPRFSERPPQTGQSYYYEIRAYDKAGNESAGSTDQGPVPSRDLTPPATPKLTATGTEDANELSWTAPSDAVSYRVYRRAAGAADFTALGDTTSTSYTDAKAAYRTAYDYKVAALDAHGNAAYSAVVTSTRTIAPPQHVTARTDSGETVVGWAEPAGTADYVVRRSADHADGSRDWATLTCGSPTSATDAAGGTERTCTDYSGRRGTTYHYTVLRKDSAGRWSVPSAEVTATRPGDETPPPAVTGVAAEPLEYGIRLSWQPSTAPDLASYALYQQQDESHDPEYLGKVDASTTQTLLPWPADGTSYRLFVVAVDVYGNSLTYQDDPDVEDWSVPVASVPVTALDLRPTSVPDDTAGCQTTTWRTAAGIRVEPWCPYEDTSSVTGFHVYRWDHAEGRFVRLTEAPVAKSRDGWFWTDTHAPAGTTLYYMLSLVRADGTESFADTDYVITPPSAS
ncbi:MULTISPECIES: fibronectin type III domain-containing protein [unclassified Streptomyces]|uniref:fibronectin type III domain-containing protein n=1 Tax=unclassified Streptomyces TaxID=2593676 RepID=UPI0040435DFD